ncbi:spermatogenesis-associated protein 46 [Heteronotia binoei]|uniref:spermatogenesis-associated protein 46 n=1 Tax=Heteronotia binoei TaxID=13085 RepID=UPI00293103B9|nr:spermatogenesis-associated protein 46 [Heteronotia binoei]
MENFSLLTISGPRLPSFALKSLPDLTCPVVHTASLPDCLLMEMQSDDPLRRNCAIYRPWYSPYSYFVCMDKSAPVDSFSLPGILGVSGGDIPVEAGQAEEASNSASSSSGSLEKARPQESSSRKGRPTPEAKDSITSQDILLASRWHPLQQNGYKCMACCRMFPTLHSLKTHIKCGLKEGFSCKVYYQKLKALWEKEHKCQVNKCPAGGGCHSPRKLK